MALKQASNKRTRTESGAVATITGLVVAGVAGAVTAGVVGVTSTQVAKNITQPGPTSSNSNVNTPNYSGN